MNKSTIQNSNPMSDKGPQSPSALHDVIIVGAGPVGLFLACELGLAGVSVLVLERTEDLRSP
jgi:cation diffusion facilitator CzcD-associated flavoprotein CzcO